MIEWNDSLEGRVCFTRACAWCAKGGKASLAERISEERVGDKGGHVDVAVGIEPIEGSVWVMEKVQNSTEYVKS